MCTGGHETEEVYKCLTSVLFQHSYQQDDLDCEDVSLKVAGNAQYQARNPDPDPDPNPRFNSVEVNGPGEG